MAFMHMMSLYELLYVKEDINKRIIKNLASYYWYAILAS